MTTLSRRGRKAREGRSFVAVLASVACFVVIGFAQPPVHGTATFAGGCFWSMEHAFDELPGVISVTVGYAGGAAKNPSYEQVEMGVAVRMAVLEALSRNLPNQ